MSKKKILTAEELASFVGRLGTYRARADMQVEIRVVNAREAYGRLDFLVTPIAGIGEAWISQGLVNLHQNEPPLSLDSLAAQRRAAEEGSF